MDITRALSAAPHPSLRATFSPQGAGRRKSAANRGCPLRPASCGEKVPEGRMRGSTEAGES